MPKRVRIALIYAVEEATRFLESSIECDKIVAMTPGALMVLNDAEVTTPIVQPRDYFSNDAYASALLEYRAHYLALDKALASDEAVPDSLRFLAHYALRGIWVSARRLESIVSSEDADWIVPTREDGEPVAIGREDVTAAVVRLFMGYFQINWIGYHPYKEPPARWFYRLLRNVVLGVLPNRDGTVHVARSDHPYGFEKVLRQAGGRFIHVWPVTRGWAEYPILIREMFRALRGNHLIQVRTLSDPDTTAAQNCVAAMSLGLPDAVRSFLDNLTPDLMKKFTFVAGLKSDTATVLKSTRARCFFGYEISDGFLATLASGVRDRGGYSVIMNHNTHSRGGNDMGVFAVEEMARTQHPPFLTDFALVWHPEAMTTVRNACADLDGVGVAPVYRSLLDTRSSAKSDDQTDHVKRDDEFTILYASNAHRWMRHFHWKFEFSDEFADTTNLLFDTVEGLADTRLIARIKFRDEVPRSLYHESRITCDRIEIRGRNDIPFSADLNKADLLISFSSTTIYQALAARIPVLILSTSGRYFKDGCLAETPTRERRSAIYELPADTSLTTMIAAIQEAHRGAPLTDEEVAGVLFDDKLAKSRPALAEAILKGRAALQSFIDSDQCILDEIHKLD